MKKILFTICTIFFTTINVIAQNVTEHTNFQNPIKYNNETFYLAWTSHPQYNYYLQEYIPKDEAVESFNQMLSLSILLTDITLDYAVKAKTEELNNRKKVDSYCNYTIKKNNGEYIIDFIVSESEENKVQIAEYNIYRYKNIKINNENAILLYFYSHRAYKDNVNKDNVNKDNVNTFLTKTVKENRTKWINEIKKQEISNIKLK